MNILSIILKDLKIILSDKKALAIRIAMPIILTAILSMALAGAFTEIGNSEKINISIVKEYSKEDGIKNTKKLLNNDLIVENLNKDNLVNLEDSIDKMDPEKIFFDDFLGSNEVSEVINYEVASKKEACDLLNSKQISAIVILPQDYIFNMYTNLLTPFRNEINIKVITHPDMNLEGKIVGGIVNGFSDMISSMIISKNVFIQTTLQNNLDSTVFNDLDNIIEDFVNEIDNKDIDIKDVKVRGKKPISSHGYYSIAMTTMFILFAAATGGKLLLKESDNKTYQRMIMSGTSKWNILVGKFCSVYVLAVIQIAIMIIFTSLVMKVNWGKFINVITITLIVTFSIAALGVFLAVLTYKVGNYKMADVFGNVVIQFMALLGGSFIPIEIMPGFIRNLSNFTINGLALKSYMKNMMGYPINDIFILLLGLIVIGVILILISLYIFKDEKRWKNA